MSIQRYFVLHVMLKLPNWMFKWQNLSQWPADMIKIVLYLYVVH